MKVPDDPELDAMITEVTEDWAELSADEDGEGLAMAHIRRAYGAGYLRGLSELKEQPTTEVNK